MRKEALKAYPVLLAGGTGTRLWPVSRELFPKQLMSLIGSESLIQSTINRLRPVLDPKDATVVCGKEHYYEIKRHLDEIGVPSEGRIIAEPCGRNTAPAILLAALQILKKEKDAVMVVLPADHFISNVQSFHEKLAEAVSLATAGHIVTFGIKPGYPETGYGYIEAAQSAGGGALRVKRFVEKPDHETAKGYIRAGNFYWNSGMFAFTAKAMVSEFAKFQPKMLRAMRAMLKKGAVTAKGYEALEDLSIDYAIMEKTDKAVVLPSDFGWSDIGSWKSLYDFMPKDEDGNVSEGDAMLRNTKGSFVKSHGRLVVTNGVKDIVVVETPDTVFVSGIEESQDVKKIVSELKSKNRPEYKAHTTVYRPWGTYTVLEEDEGSKIKRIVVYPGAKLSLQRHMHRSEHWVVARGTARITNDGKVSLLHENQSTYVPKTGMHRLQNPGSVPLHIIEIQLGSYLGEDDIQRFDDDFGRGPNACAKKPLKPRKTAVRKKTKKQ